MVCSTDFTVGISFSVVKNVDCWATDAYREETQNVYLNAKLRLILLLMKIQWGGNILRLKEK